MAVLFLLMSDCHSELSPSSISEVWMGLMAPHTAGLVRRKWLCLASVPWPVWPPQWPWSAHLKWLFKPWRQNSDKHWTLDSVGDTNTQTSFKWELICFSISSCNSYCFVSIQIYVSMYACLYAFSPQTYLHFCVLAFIDTEKEKKGGGGSIHRWVWAVLFS